MKLRFLVMDVGGLVGRVYLSWDGEGWDIVDVLEKSGLCTEWDNNSWNAIAILPTAKRMG